MDMSKLIPAHRIEIRRAGSAPSDPWLPAEFAHSENHVKARLPFWQKQPDIEVRVVDNFTTDAASPKISVAASTTPSLPSAVQTPLTTPPAIVATAPAVVAPGLTGAPVVVAGASPLPEDYGVGKFVRDRFTGIVVRVTALNPIHPFTERVREGFAWENTTTKPGDKDHTGFCPIGSVGCFEPTTSTGGTVLGADGIAGAKEVPFALNEYVRDRFTKVIVQVTGIDPEHPITKNRRKGFAWLNTTTQVGDKDHVGFCPLQSVGCFERVKTEPPTAAPVPVAPEPTPPIAASVSGDSSSADDAGDVTPPAAKSAADTAKKSARTAAPEKPKRKR